LFDDVPVAHDGRGPAAGTPGGLAVRVVHVARVDVTQTVVEGDLAGAAQGVRRRRGNVTHLEVWMEGGEVQGYVWAEVVQQPFTLLRDLGVGVVVPGNQQRRDLEPD